jgi:hypothetical protein
MKTAQTDIYIQTVLSGKTNSLAAILDKNIEALAPTSGEVITNTAAIIGGLSLVSKIISDLKIVRTYDGEGNWHAAVFEGKIDCKDIQFSDHLHINDSGLVDRIEIFLRPSSLAGSFYGRMTALISQHQ